MNRPVRGNRVALSEGPQRLPAGVVEAAVIQEIRTLVRTPEIAAQTIAAVRQQAPELSERDVIAALISRAAAFNFRQVIRNGRCSAPSRSACCRPAHEPRGLVPRRAADQGRSTSNALHSELYTPILPDGLQVCGRGINVQKRSA